MPPPGEFLRGGAAVGGRWARLSFQLKADWPEMTSLTRSDVIEAAVGRVGGAPSRRLLLVVGATGRRLATNERRGLSFFSFLCADWRAGRFERREISAGGRAAGGGHHGCRLKNITNHSNTHTHTHNQTNKQRKQRNKSPRFMPVQVGVFCTQVCFVFCFCFCFCRIL